MELNKETSLWKDTASTIFNEVYSIVIDLSVYEAVLADRIRRNVSSEYIASNLLPPQAINHIVEYSKSEIMRRIKDMNGINLDMNEQDAEQFEIATGFRAAHAFHELMRSQAMYADIRTYILNRQVGLKLMQEAMSTVTEFAELTRQQGTDRIYDMSVSSAGITEEELDSQDIPPTKIISSMVYVAVRSPETGVVHSPAKEIVADIIQSCPEWDSIISKLIEHGFVGVHMQNELTSSHACDWDRFIAYISSLPETAGELK